MAASVLAVAVLLAALIASAPSDAKRSKKVGLRGANTTLTIDKGTAGALDSLGISVKRVKPATNRPGGFRFPISGGRVDPKTLAGQIRHTGGLAFVKGSTRVELTRFYINIDSAPDLTAKLGGDRVSILSLDLSGLQRKDRGKTIRLSGIRADLTAAAAGALNDAFSTTAFTEGLTLGTAKVKAVVR
jgi:hypothetical protein